MTEAEESGELGGMLAKFCAGTALGAVLCWHWHW